MSTATNAAASRWADLPPDLLRDVSGRPTTSSASTPRASRARGTLPSTTFHPPLPPLARVHLAVPAPSRTWRRMSSRDKWPASADGAGTWFLTDSGSGSPCLVNPLTGAATSLPRFPDETNKRIDEFADGTVCDDGTILVYAVRYYHKYTSYIRAAILRPGDEAWTEVETELLRYTGLIRFQLVIRILIYHSVIPHPFEFRQATAVCYNTAWTLSISFLVVLGYPLRMVSYDAHGKISYVRG